jgi:hypothetical protein
VKQQRRGEYGWVGVLEGREMSETEQKCGGNFAFYGYIYDFNF